MTLKKNSLSIAGCVPFYLSGQWTVDKHQRMVIGISQHQSSKLICSQHAMNELVRDQPITQQTCNALLKVVLAGLRLAMEHAFFLIICSLNQPVLNS